MSLGLYEGWRWNQTCDTNELTSASPFGPLTYTIHLWLAWSLSSRCSLGINLQTSENNAAGNRLNVKDSFIKAVFVHWLGHVANNNSLLLRVTTDHVSLCHYHRLHAHISNHYIHLTINNQQAMDSINIAIIHTHARTHTFCSAMTVVGSVVLWVTGGTLTEVKVARSSLVSDLPRHCLTAGCIGGWQDDCCKAVYNFVVNTR